MMSLVVVVVMGDGGRIPVVGGVIDASASTVASHTKRVPMDKKP